MRTIRSLLWIGPCQGLADCGIGAAPTLDVTWVQNVEEAFALPAIPFDAVVLEGTRVDALGNALARLRQRPNSPPRLVCLREANGQAIRDLLSRGANEVIALGAEPSDPDWLEELLEAVERLQARAPSPRSGAPHPAATLEHPPFAHAVGRSRAIREIWALAERAQRSMANVLLCGETGTGKELVAQAIHSGSPRARRPFVAVNCAAFPEGLLESELFGHKRGAFTGADRDKPGLFVAAGGGSLFLDEIGETSPALQAKLLRVLQEREVRPLGAAQPQEIDVRVIAATNRSLEAEIDAGRFRQDLFYRLAVFPIAIPALRERPEDILALAEHFLKLYGQREQKPGCRLSAASQRLLQTHRWPGNVRELENEIQRALALAEPGELITPKLLSARVLGIVEAVDQAACSAETLRETLSRIEAWLIRRTLDHQGGRRAATARKLGITREGLYKKMKRLGIE